ncbi:MAG: hypothetical protein WBQ73_01915 [Candidatus Babeliales bacterium]
MMKFRYSILLLIYSLSSIGFMCGKNGHTSTYEQDFLNMTDHPLKITLTYHKKRPRHFLLSPYPQTQKYTKIKPGKNRLWKIAISDVNGKPLSYYEIPGGKNVKNHIMIIRYDEKENKHVIHWVRQHAKLQ